MDTFDFLPKEMQDPEAPIQRYPVRIIFEGRVCGYYIFGKSNHFEIYFDVIRVVKPSPRFMCLAQMFHHEDECRQWLCEFTKSLITGQDLNYTDLAVELRKNPDVNDFPPYIW